MGNFRLGKYQMMEFKNWSGIAKDSIIKNQLRDVLRNDPQRATNEMIQLMAANGGPYMLESFLSKFGTKEFETGDWFYWDVIADAIKNVPLVEARDENGNPIDVNSNKMVGAGTAPFYLVFGTDWFFESETIGGRYNEQYPLQVMGDGREEGSNYVYTVTLQGGNIEGIPSELLLPGERFKWDFAATSKSFDRKKGGLRYESANTMRNNFTRLRLYDKQDSYASNNKFAVGFPCVTGVKNGKLQIEVKNKWGDVIDWKFEQTWAAYKNKMMAYARSNENANGEYTNFDSNGEVLKIGSGLFEQMEAGGVVRYNVFDIKQLNDFLTQLVSHKVGYGNRTFVMRTGTGGFRQFSEAISNLASGSGWYRGDNNAATVKKVNSEYHSNSLGFGYQFAEYYGPMGIVLKCEIDPMYDDDGRNTILWKGNLPAYSYRYDIFDLGDSNNQNIFKATVKDEPERRGYVVGPFYNPYTGQSNIQYGATDEDGASRHIKGAFGVGVLDATRTFSYVPSVLFA